MKITLLVGTLAIGAMSLALTVPSVYAQGGHGKGNGKGERHEKMAEKLNLTADQKTQIKALRDAFKQQNASAIAEVKALRDQMHEQMKNKDKEGAKATREQIKAKMEALRPAHQKLHEQILALLTPEQRAQAEKMRQEHKDRKHDRKGDGRHGDGRHGDGAGLEDFDHPEID